MFSIFKKFNRDDKGGERGLSQMGLMTYLQSYHSS